MEMKDWLPLYREIVDDLGLSEENDIMASRELAALISANDELEDRDVNLALLEDYIRSRTCIVIGGGPRLEEELDELLGGDRGLRDLGDVTFITADGATSSLMKRGITPDVIVTDLDGGFEDQRRAVLLGSLMVLHGHGDNMDVLRRRVPELSGCVVGSTQVDPSPVPGLINMGGFTDGDRAVHIALSLGAERIILVGFSGEGAGDKIMDGGRRERLKGADREMKERKLRWMRRLLDMADPERVAPFGKRSPGRR